MRYPEELPGFIQSAAYGRKYGVSNQTVIKRIKRGVIPGLMHGTCWYTEDKAPPEKAPSSGNKKRCGMCGLIKNRYEDFSPSRAHKSGVCKDCNAHRERLRIGMTKHPKSISYDRELFALKELRELPDQGVAMRERLIVQHAARIEAMGLAGNGEEFPDGE